MVCRGFVTAAKAYGRNNLDRDCQPDVETARWAVSGSYGTGRLISERRLTEASLRPVPSPAKEFQKPHVAQFL